MQNQKRIPFYINLYSRLKNGISDKGKNTQRINEKSNMNHIRGKAFICVILFIVFLSVTAVANMIFDSSVLAAQPKLLSGMPEYSSSNSVFSSYSSTVDISLTYLGGEKIDLTTDTITVEEILKKQEITLDETNTVNYPLYTVVYDGMDIIIDSVTYEEYEKTSVIPYESTLIGTPTIPYGTKSFVSKGKEGTLTTKYRKTFVNGVFKGEEAISETVTVKPTNEVAYVGCGGSFVGKDGRTYKYSYYIDVVATCYGKADGSGNFTATGKPVKEGYIAVDPTVIPYGTKCYVTGSYADLGVCYAEDTGGAIKGNRIDVYKEGTLQDLLQFGRRNMRVYILV